MALVFFLSRYGLGHAQDPPGLPQRHRSRSGSAPSANRPVLAVAAAQAGSVQRSNMVRRGDGGAAGAGAGPPAGLSAGPVRLAERRRLFLDLDLAENGMGA
jgi:hypothetical protein